MIVVTLVAGTGGAFVTSITGAGAASHPAGQGRQARLTWAPTRPAAQTHPVLRPAAPRHAAGRIRPSRPVSATAGPVLPADTVLPAGAAAVRILKVAATRPAPLVTDAVGHRRSKRGLAAPRLSAAMLLAGKIRQAQARAYLRNAHPAEARDLAGTQRAQIRDYFCGPAMVTEMLAQLNVVLHQQAAARDLGTNQSGTDWSNAHGYPVPRVLNSHQARNKYVAVALPWSPTAAQIGVFKMDLVRDISRGSGVPLAGNGYEVPGGPHLVGHPPGQTIMHWFDIRGYSHSGAVTDYEDSVHGASSIGWSAAVPAYSSVSTVTMVYILGARGYVW
ncbi:MAG TPA: hypothetical protein VMU94_00895 [Streptosporangiaceae bacterium]|nr:hypothetical protein [Streptosporangiaceae bacterium]